MTEKNATATANIPASETAKWLGIKFFPVEVSKGRKFRGRAYWINSYEKSNGGYVGSGVRPRAYYTVNVVWEPMMRMKLEYNGDIDEPWTSISPREVERDFLAYISEIAKACVTRCGTDMNWRRNYMRKVAGGTAWGNTFDMAELETLIIK